ncbi:hypothetical protein D3C80_2138870 [compost metagenome]
MAARFIPLINSCQVIIPEQLDAVTRLIRGSGGIDGRVAGGIGVGSVDGGGAVQPDVVPAGIGQTAIRDVKVVIA